MTKEFTRRNLLGRASLALGGAVALGSLACGSDDSDPQPQPQPQPQEGPQVADFPYKQHLAADFRLDVDAIKEAAYQAYYDGGCCHGSYSALLGDLQRAGAPFTLLPVAFGKFGAGGIASYGSICGSVLGSVLIINMLVEESSRNAMITEVMRWYEGFAFPQYAPIAINAKEQGKTTVVFAESNTSLHVIPGSHLCHASVTKWCDANGVSATSADKLARCARLTADVAGKTAELLNAYLAGEAFVPTALDATSAGCVGCHPKDKAADPVSFRGPSVNSGMSCTSCHPGQKTDHWTPPAQ